MSSTYYITQMAKYAHELTVVIINKCAILLQCIDTSRRLQAMVISCLDVYIFINKI